MRVVFDTNVLVSVLLFGGELEILRNFIKQGFCIPCFTSSTLAEFADVVSRDKFKEGFTSYHLNPETRLLIVYPESGPLIFRLKPDSVLLQKYIEKYPPPKPVPEPWWVKAAKRTSGEGQ